MCFILNIIENCDFFLLNMSFTFCATVCRPKSAEISEGIFIFAQNEPNHSPSTFQPNVKS